MPQYLRSRTPNACYFFTVVTYHRRKLFATQENVDLLRDALKNVKTTRPFDVNAIVILPDRLHCLWRLPAGDADYSGRWREIKKIVTKHITQQRNERGERDVWQRRFWEHQVRDEQDWQNHMDYIHYNPVKHGYVSAPRDWLLSSFDRWVREGCYTPDWGTDGAPNDVLATDRE